LSGFACNATRGVKDESFEANVQTVGPGIKELARQRKTTHAGL